MLHLLAGDALDGAVQIAVLFCQLVLLFGERSVCQPLFEVYQIQQLVQEPAVNHGLFVQFFDGHATLQGFKYLECPFIIDHIQVFHDFIQRHLCIFLHVHGVNAQFNRTNCLHDCLFKARADCHDFTGCLHLSAQCPLCIDKFIKCPLWVLYNDIVQSRFKASVSLAGYLVDDFIQRVPDGNSGCNLCNRVTGCFRSQCRRTGYTRIYLDYTVLERIRVQCVLHVDLLR